VLLLVLASKQDHITQFYFFKPKSLLAVVLSQIAHIPRSCL